MPIVDRFHRNVPPRNNGSANIARSAIDQIQPIAAQQYQRALEVNGRPVLYFSKKLSGLRCTCAYGQNEQLTAPMLAETPPPNDGFGSAEFIDSMVQGTTFSINRYGDRPKDLSFTPPQQSPLQFPFTQKTDKLNDPLRPNVGVEDTEDFVEDTSQNLFNEAPKSCAICLNTGFVGGYDAQNMLRHVYDSQNDWSNVVFLNNTRPFSMLASGNPTVPVLVPAGARNLVALRIWNNREQLSSVSVLSGGVPLIASWRNSAGTNALVSLEFAESNAEFTHIELMWDIGMPPLLVEWSKLAYSENLDVLDQISDVQVVISPRVPSVSLYDIIVEDTFNRSWKVSDVNTNFDREKHVGGWGASLRVLQKYEIYNLLPHMMLRTYNWANQTVPVQRQVAGIAPVEPFSAGQQTPFR